MSKIYRRAGALLSALAMCAALSAPAAAKERPMLVPMGCTVGIAMSTDGALVIGLASTENGGAPSPAAQAGLLPGDLITAVDGEKVGSAAELRESVGEMSGESLVVSVKRGEESMELSLCPNCENGRPELGLWLRDSVAGIGTLTFYDPQSGLYGALGHGVNDVDSGVMLPLGEGSIMSSSVSEVKKGAPGAPGELRGAIETEKKLGEIAQNTGCGIFGQLSAAPTGEAIPIAFSSELELGAASILSNVSGTEIEEFEVEITRVYRGDDSGRSLMLSVKDEALLERTGGIVQGMSGSPIVQNGRLVGAVTHVLVNDPTRGFGIGIEQMISAGKGGFAAAA